MVKKKRFYSANLKNNCPECFNTEGLELDLFQFWQENKLFKRATQEMESLIRCHHCEAIIYPVNWTDDIERVYDYHKKLAEAPHFFKLKPLALFLIILVLTLIGFWGYTAIMR